MSLIMISGLEKEELMETTATEEDLKKKKRMEMCESKPTRPSDDAMFLRKGIINAIHRSDEKWKVTQRKQMKKMANCLLADTNSVGTQLRGMNSTIENLKEEGVDKYKHIDERIADMEKKFFMFIFFEKVRSKLMDPAQNHGKTVATNFHGDISEQQVEHLLRRR